MRDKPLIQLFSKLTQMRESSNKKKHRKYGIHKFKGFWPCTQQSRVNLASKLDLRLNINKKQPVEIFAQPDRSPSKINVKKVILKRSRLNIS